MTNKRKRKLCVITGTYTLRDLKTTTIHITFVTGTPSTNVGKKKKRKKKGAADWTKSVRNPLK